MQYYLVNIADFLKVTTLLVLSLFLRLLFTGSKHKPSHRGAWLLLAFDGYCHISQTMAALGLLAGGAHITVFLVAFMQTPHFQNCERTDRTKQ